MSAEQIREVTLFAAELGSTLANICTEASTGRTIRFSSETRVALKNYLSGTLQLLTARGPLSIDVTFVAMVCEAARSLDRKKYTDTMPDVYELLDEDRAHVRVGAITPAFALDAVNDVSAAVVQLARLLQQMAATSDDPVDIADNDDDESNVSVHLLLRHAVAIYRVLGSHFHPFARSLCEHGSKSGQELVDGYKQQPQMLMTHMQEVSFMSATSQNFQWFVGFAYQQFVTFGARIHNGIVYYPIYSGSYCTRAYMPMKTPEEMLFTYFSTGHNVEAMTRATSSINVVSQTASFVESHRDPQGLPELHVDRSAWSMRDGVYDGNTRKFHPYDKGLDGYSTHTGSATAKYFDLNVGHLFPEEGRRRERVFPHFPEVTQEQYDSLPEFMHIQTKSLDKILHFQLLNQSKTFENVRTYMFMLGMLGRLMFSQMSPGDNRQVMAFIIGAAGTGKSVLLNMMKHVYAPGMVATIGSDMQSTFGLENLHNKLLILCSEVPVHNNQGLKFEQFKQMVSNDMMSVNVKNKTTITLPKWDVPMLWAMNKLPPYDAESRSFLRRILLFEFLNTPDVEDHELENDLMAEMGNVIVKLCEARKWLLDEITKYGNLERSLPEPLRSLRTKYEIQFDPCRNFLVNSGLLQISHGDEMPLRDIMSLFFQWCEGNNVTLKKDPNPEVHHSTMLTHLLRHKDVSKRTIKTVNALGIEHEVTMVVNISKATPPDAQM